MSPVGAEMGEECGWNGDSAVDDELCDTVNQALSEVTTELDAAMRKFPAMNSPHEGYAVLDEEVDELWEHVKVKQGQRDWVAMRKEAIQVAAMAIRFAVDVCKPGA